MQTFGLSAKLQREYKLLFQRRWYEPNQDLRGLPIITWKCRHINKHHSLSLNEVCATLSKRLGLAQRRLIVAAQRMERVVSELMCFKGPACLTFHVV